MQLYSSSSRNHLTLLVECSKRLIIGWNRYIIFDIVDGEVADVADSDVMFWDAKCGAVCWNLKASAIVTLRLEVGIVTLRAKWALEMNEEDGIG